MTVCWLIDYAQLHLWFAESCVNNFLKCSQSNGEERIELYNIAREEVDRAEKLLIKINKQSQQQNHPTAAALWEEHKIEFEERINLMKENLFENKKGED